MELTLQKFFSLWNKTEPLRRPLTQALQKRRAIVSCVTDNFIGMGATFLASLTETKSIPHDTDVLLLVDDMYAPLSEFNRSLLRTIYPAVQFIQQDTRYLSDELVQRWKAGVRVKANIDRDLPAKKSVYLKLSIFQLDKYRRILWLDSDMMALRPVAELLSPPCAFCVVPAGPPDMSFGLAHEKSGRWNSGLMSISDAFLGKKWFDIAVKMLREKKHTDVQDQSLLNTMLRDQRKLFLPHTYNWKLPANVDSPAWSDAVSMSKMVHFVAQSKWLLADGSRDTPLSRLFHETRDRWSIPLTIKPG